MFKILCPVPKKITVALSGGVDSVAVVDFFSKTREVRCAFYHHGTPEDIQALKFVTKFCEDRSLDLIIGNLKDAKPSDISPEEHWRNCRYKFLDELGTVITGHNLDDSVETFLYSSLHGRPKVIPVRRNNVIRPFLSTPKQAFIDWCVRKNVPWFEDTSNKDPAMMRNYIRHTLMPHALHVNPGLFKVVRKIVLDKAKEPAIINI